MSQYRNAEWGGNIIIIIMTNQYIENILAYYKIAIEIAKTHTQIERSKLIIINYKKRQTEL